MGARLAVYGAGGAGREIAWLARVCLGSDADIRFIVDENFATASVVNDLEVMPFKRFASTMRDVPVVIAVGDCASRQRMSEACEAVGLKFQTLIHPSVALSPFVNVGNGSIICEGAIITTNVDIGCHVYINVGSTISHDCALGDFTTLSPGVHLAGWVRAGRRVFFGAGATVLNGSQARPISVGDDAIIGAGACVIDDISPGATAVGVPARSR
jgi:sugar O-acyltransferase (sialic acid O-acetyltransferase NeuD family)